MAKEDKCVTHREMAAVAGLWAKVPVESERGVLMGLLGGKEWCEAKVGQMVADNEGIEV